MIITPIQDNIIIKLPKVIFNKFAGTKIQSEDEEYLIVRENDILAIIK